jgi:multimeric flavodoxin WrbA
LVTYNGNLSGVYATLTDNVTAPLFNGNLLGTTANLTDNVTAPLFIGNLQGGGDTKISSTTGNIIMNKAPIITHISGNLNGAAKRITGNMVDTNTYYSWYPLMYNPRTGEIKFGPPPYPS